MMRIWTKAVKQERKKTEKKQVFVGTGFGNSVGTGFGNSLYVVCETERG